jgi:hypothetical protein
MKREREGREKGRDPRQPVEKKITKKQGQSDFLRQTFEQTKNKIQTLDGHPQKQLICGQLEAYLGSPQAELDLAIQQNRKIALGNLAK